MNLIIDIGNTAAKLAVMKGSKVVNLLVDSTSTLEEGGNFVRQHRDLPTIVASVRGTPNTSGTPNKPNEAEKMLSSLAKKPLWLTHQTPLPITNLYATPETLGKDRLAAAVGAAYLYPKQNVLVVDAGTAITYEFVNDRAEYMGGNISPGIDLRFRALHLFTGKLPLCHRTETYPALGADTQSAIVAGVLGGVVHEVEAVIKNFLSKTPNLTTILTGGDAVFFANRLKIPIFVACDLVLIGLNRILEYVHAKS